MRSLRLLVSLVLFSTLVVSASPGTFETARRVPVGTAPSGIGVGDFNNDRKLDMVVCNNQDSSVSVLLGKGDGTFETQKVFALDGPPVALAVGDFNRDGNLDVAVVTTDLFILLGNGDGTLRYGGTFTVGGSLGSIVASDFNHDGKLDVAIVSQNPQGVNVLLGNGDGTFQSPANYATTSSPVGVAVGDFNGDGKVDLVVSNYYPDIGINVFWVTGRGILARQLSRRIFKMPACQSLPTSTATAIWMSQRAIWWCLAMEKASSISRNTSDSRTTASKPLAILTVTISLT